MTRHCSFTNLSLSPSFHPSFPLSLLPSLPPALHPPPSSPPISLRSPHTTTGQKAAQKHADAIPPLLTLSSVASTPSPALDSAPAPSNPPIPPPPPPRSPTPVDAAKSHEVFEAPEVVIDNWAVAIPSTIQARKPYFLIGRPYKPTLRT